MENIQSEKEICEYYLLGNTIRDTAKKFKKHSPQISKILKKNNVKIKFGSRVKTNGINDKYFEEIDCEEKSYFIGFIAADGYIAPDGYKITIGLNIRDIEILEKFKELTGCTNKISILKVWDKRTKKYYDKCCIQICSKKIVYSLKKYGLTHTKTKDYVIQNIPEKYMKDCIRGLMDGDGHLGDGTISLITTIENINIISKFAEKIGVFRQKYIEDVKSEENTFKMCIGKGREKFLYLLYNDCKICLSRKMESYLNIMHEYYSMTRLVWNREVFAYKDGTFFKKYNSVKECSVDTEVSSRHIYNIISGKIKRSKGFSFIFGEKKKVKILANNEIIV